MSISDRRTGATYEQQLYARAGVEVPKLVGGSGYFTRPSATLDPHLFLEGTTVMRPMVRQWVLSKLYTFWAPRYHEPRAWSTVWIAGSGVTYQWDAARESNGAPGDLDVLVGVDFLKFFAYNPRFDGFDERVMAEHFNDEFRGVLDQATNHAVLPDGGSYEVTFYVNPGATDIRAINPYAAYDLTHGSWTVPPIDLPADWGSKAFAQDWWDHIHAEREHAGGIVRAYRAALHRAKGLPEMSPQWLNAMTDVHDMVRSGARLFDDVHDSRHNAFSKDGKGYLDYYNFRWQAHKRDGLVNAMLSMKRLDTEAHKAHADSLYGGPIIDAQHALDLAALAQE